MSRTTKKRKRVYGRCVSVPDLAYQAMVAGAKRLGFATRKRNGVSALVDHVVNAAIAREGGAS